jgi:hypothetical protein
MTQHKNSSDGENSPQDFWQNAQELMQAGSEAARLLNSEVFNLAYRLQMEDTVNQWLTSEPKETNKRDSLYYQSQALVAMATRLQSFVEQAQVIMQKQAATQDPRGKHAEYLDTQGFGIQ